MRSACGWAQFKFGVQLDPEEMKNLDARAFDGIGAPARRRSVEVKEAEFPVRAVISHFTARDPQGQKRYDRDQLVAWARQRFQIDLNVDDLRTPTAEEVQQMLVEYSKQARPGERDAGRGTSASR